ncbi:hypothetical protein [Capnocytophaga sp.]|uniref:hypothetical protein n=1 Tax=Capnocytophaga sp. TaxID=44737 RepID=UPI0026DBB68B|nr:hypothetical protein [Capnocytophaga sp.]MDO5104757.1 hypothetical protein [Capnocytophaga sp.]
MIRVLFGKRKQFGFFLINLLIVIVYVPIVIYSASNWLLQCLFAIVLIGCFYVLLIMVKRLFSKENSIIISKKGIDFRDGYRTFSADWNRIVQLQMLYFNKSVRIFLFEEVEVGCQLPFFTYKKNKKQLVMGASDLKMDFEIFINHLFSYFMKYKNRYVSHKNTAKKNHIYTITDTNLYSSLPKAESSS